MLQSLTIENYALIDKLHIGFSDGLSIITGETGAGKSILLGALSLILGQRADSLAVQDAARNCIVEGEFTIDGYGLEALFLEKDIDYAPVVTIRRLIMQGGKSRAFVNDVPVTLNVLKELGDRLIDIHSQHQNLLLGSSAFQLDVLDAQAGHAAALQRYRRAFADYKTACTALKTLQDKADRSRADYDYLQFQYGELQAAQLKSGEQQALDEELQQLSHAGEIKTALWHSLALLQDDERAAIAALRDVAQGLQKIEPVWPAASTLAERVGSCRLELSDIAAEIGAAGERIESDPVRQQWVEDRLNTLYSLQHKHRVSDVEALIALKESIGERLHTIDSFDRNLEELQARCSVCLQQVEELAAGLSDGRRRTAPAIMPYVTGMLRTLGMPHAVFTITITPAEQYGATGRDTVQFLFSANREIPPQEISRVASGGEMSRLMLCLKSLLVKGAGLPTIVFDEIDTGVSGEIADKMGSIIYDLSKTMQVINITHLPQIAGKGDRHYVVYKELTTDGHPATRIKLLTRDERIMEIAKMLSGQNITPAAIANAKELLMVNG
ncbi:MAG: DNA repair protein RecN [Prevotellaceae bacterium]|nr:DNA repair protein RecN [Prevotellaceae bacterium]